MFIFYAHGGSDNHGCEAIVRGSMKIIDKKAILYSGNTMADHKYYLNTICDIRSDTYKRYHHPMKWAFYKISYMLFKKSSHFKLVDGQEKGVYLSIGGDNYCYPALIKPIIEANKRIRNHGNKNILWGTSIEPSVLENDVILEDIRGYDLLFVRESLTYNALINVGLKEKTFLYPDPAFAMKCIETKLPEGLYDKPVIGINISPLIMKYGQEQNVIKDGYLQIIQFILDHTDCNIAFIPHVVKRNNDDRETLHMLKDELNSDRIYMIQDSPAEQLKYYISKCTFFVGARTHSTIAAYSTCVRTLVIGYSIKARGIAKDIFGTEDDYVVDVRTLTNGNDMLMAFQKLYLKKDDIGVYLKGMMPDYINKAKQAGTLLVNYINDNHAEL